MGGTISPAGFNPVKYRDSLTFSVAADDGFVLNDVRVDGQSVGAVSEYTFTDIREDHWITARFLCEDGSVPSDGTTYYETYTALGDGVTSGLGLAGYAGNFSNPETGYVANTANALGAVTNYNLGVRGFTSDDLLNALTNPESEYYTQFVSNIQDADLVSVDIGANDLTMALIDTVIDSLGGASAEFLLEDKLAIMAPLLEDTSIDSFIASLKAYLKMDISVTKLIKLFTSAANKQCKINICGSFRAVHGKLGRNRRGHQGDQPRRVRRCRGAHQPLLRRGFQL